MKNVKRHPLGRFESPNDPRDWKLQNFADSGMEVESQIRTIHHPFRSKSLAQGNTGHCCGFADANYLINDPVNTPCTNEDGHRFYYLCKEFDGEPGNEEGSNIRSAAKVLRSLGRISNYAFANSFEMIKWWLLNRGPLVVGTYWHDGMFDPDETNTVYPTGMVNGGHAYIANGIDETYIYFQNSWGEDWGDNGAFRMLIPDFIKIFAIGGEALAAVELENMTTKKINVIELIINWIISLLKGELK